MLVDRSNIEQIETVGNKFYNFDTEEWVKLETEEFEIDGSNGKTCKFLTSPYGTLYSKSDRKGKNQEYISRWHENEKKVRVLFQELFEFVKNDGVMMEGRTKMEFPFNSIVLANNTGIFQYLCPQKFPSYFLYPDMFSEPDQITERWVSYEGKKFLAVSNTILTTMKQTSYSKYETLSPHE